MCILGINCELPLMLGATVAVADSVVCRCRLATTVVNVVAAVNGVCARVCVCVSTHVYLYAFSRTTHQNKRTATHSLVGERAFVRSFVCTFESNVYECFILALNASEYGRNDTFVLAFNDIIIISWVYRYIHMCRGLCTYTHASG